MPFFIIFILVPLLEIAIFMAASDYIGIGTTLLLALLTAITGGAIVKHQGIQTIFSAQTAMNNGKIPSKELFDGLCLVAAGALLITPGFLTDTLGFLLLIPVIRNILRDKISKNAKFQTMHFETGFYEQSPYGNKPTDPNIIEAEYEKLNEANTDKDKP